MNNIDCLVHNLPADWICLNRKCNKKKIICPKCQQEGIETVCVQDHKEDMLVLSDCVDTKLNDTYHQIRGQYLKDEEYLYKTVANLNRFKLEHLGRDFYYFLQEYSYKGIQTKPNTMTKEEFDHLMSYNTSQNRFRAILDSFTDEVQQTQKTIQASPVQKLEDIQGMEKQITNKLSQSFFDFKKDLQICQDIVENSPSYQESITDLEIEGLFKKIKKLVTEFVDKKIKRKNKKKLGPDEISKIECKQLEDGEQQKPIEVINVDNPSIQDQIPDLLEGNQIEFDQIEQKQETNQIQSTLNTFCGIDHIVPIAKQNQQRNERVYKLNEIQLRNKNKVYRIAVSADEVQISITCGGWINSSGNCMIFEIDRSENTFSLRKTISYGNYKFVDSAFSECGKYLCVCASQKVFVFKTDLAVTNKHKDYLDKTPLLKISTTFDVKAVKILYQHNLNKEQEGVEEVKEEQKDDEQGSSYLLAIGGYQYFQIIRLSPDIKTYLTIIGVVVQGQVENIQFCFDNQYVAFTVYEAQQIYLYDIKGKQICYISPPLGFEVWYIQIEPINGLVCVSGEDSRIHLFSLDESNATLIKHSYIETQFSGVITSFAFHKQFLFISGSDNSFKIFQQKQKKLSNEVFYQKEYSSSPDLHLIPILSFCPINQQIITGCQNGKLVRWQFNQDEGVDV